MLDKISGNRKHNIIYYLCVFEGEIDKLSSIVRLAFYFDVMTVARVRKISSVGVFCYCNL